MADFELTLNEDKLIRATRESFKEANELFNRQTAEAITKNQWGWPADPSPRDIVDTGQLRQSYQAEAGLEEYSHSWDTEYAAAVHNGAVFKSGHSMPARPWTKEPLSKFEDNYQKLLDSKL